MSLKNKLQVEIASGRISLRPNRRMINSLPWLALTMVVFGGVLVLWKDELGENAKIICLVVVIYATMHGLADLLRMNVRYTFDKQTNAIYQERVLLGRKQLMKLDEAVIFTSSESGSWHYSLGIRKKQFLKNYKISPNFGNGKKSEQLIAEFKADILSPIMQLLERTA
ncbi:MAG: hypothetical protein QM727_02395 [Niabella sp.]